MGTWGLGTDPLTTLQASALGGTRGKDRPCARPEPSAEDVPVATWKDDLVEGNTLTSEIIWAFEKYEGHYANEGEQESSTIEGAIHQEDTTMLNLIV